MLIIDIHIIIKYLTISQRGQRNSDSLKESIDYYCFDFTMITKISLLWVNPRFMNFKYERLKMLRISSKQFKISFEKYYNFF